MENNEKEKKELEYGDNELEYVIKWANYYFPSFPPDEFEVPEGHDISEYTGESMYIYRFMDRYNDRLLKANFNFKKYIENKEFDLYFKQFGIDRIKFWYLLLFIYDFSWGKCKEAFKIESIEEKIRPLNEHVEKLSKNIRYAQKVNLVLREDKKIISRIDDFDVIRFMVECTRKELKDLYSRKKDVITRQTISDSQMAYYFAQQVLSFFNIIPSIIEKRREGAKISDMEKDFIVEIMKFIKLVASFTSSSNKEYFNALMNQYKNKPITGINNFYIY